MLNNCAQMTHTLQSKVGLFRNYNVTPRRAYRIADFASFSTKTEFATYGSSMCDEEAQASYRRGDIEKLETIEISIKVPGRSPNVFDEFVFSIHKYSEW